MFNCWYVIVIALSIYHETNAEELSRQCIVSQGRCALTKNSNCESSFGSGWTQKGSCCRRRPCCVYILVVQCEDIPSNNLTNGAVTVAERIIGSTANFTCDAGHSIVGNDSITCTSLGWNGNIPQCRFQCEDIPTGSLTNGTVNVPERNVGSTATFSCHTGHHLIGRKSITCTTSGWNGDIPQCAKIVCPETVAFFRGSKYIFKCDMAYWSTSEANCNVLGGHLTSIETGDENAFLLDVISLMQTNTEQIQLAFFWIGLTDNNDEMTYKWLSGKPLNYSDWYQGPPLQPDNKNMNNQQGAHCAMINQMYSVKWGDELCWEPNFSVCEVRLK